MSEPKLNLEHLACIATILEAIPAGTGVARAMVAIEDVYVALALGLQTGLSLEQVQTFNREILNEYLLAAKHSAS